MTTEAEWSWVAGIIEGEGCFGICKRQQAVPNTSLRVNMTDEDVIRRLQTVTGKGRVTGPYTKSNPKHKPWWCWSVNRADDLADIVTAIGPWMGSRRAARLAEFRAIFAIKKVRRVPQTIEQIAERRRAGYRRNAARIIAYQMAWRRAKATGVSSCVA